MQYWGIDTEATATGKERKLEDVHTIQICSSEGEHTGKVFWNARDFKEWLGHRHNRPPIFYSFTLTFEYGTLAAWELLQASTDTGQYPWQSWADEPINLFYITIDKTRIPVYDIRVFFYQLRHGNSYLTNLVAVGDYLSDYYGKDIHKLDHPLGEDFGKRPPTEEEKPYFEKYGVRDSYINAKAAQWVHENILEKWLQNVVPITKIYSWGTVAKHYFKLPKIATVKHYGKTITIKFPNYWHEKIFNHTFAGRNESFHVGNIGYCYYCDVSSLYPISIIQTQCMLIKDIAQWHGNTDGLIGKINWEIVYEQTGYPYGWILGDFHTTDDLWSLPVKVGENNWYVTGTLKNQLYNTLDLEASNAEILDVQTVLIPVFTTDPAFLNPMRKYEELTEIKLNHKYENQVHEYSIKSTINATSGILGKSHPNFGSTTNIPAYNIMLGQSHLYMSQIFHQFYTPDHPIYYMDTDSLFYDKPIEETIRECEPYPTLPFQVLNTVSLNIGVKGAGNTTLFRAKMYYQSDTSLGFSAWKPFPQFFKKIIQEKPLEIDIERQITRKWKTRDKNVTALKIGRWFIKREHWNLDKLKRIFRADDKRYRPTYDSYQLFLDNESASSHAWTVREALQKLSEKTWNIKIR